jgi:hypothetical protein
MYGLGKGVIRDNVYAHMWHSIAASNGNKFAAEIREILAVAMTSSQLEKAKKVARECVRKKYKDC